MTNNLKSAITRVAIAIAALLMFSGFSSAQETVLGNISFNASGSARSMQANSSFSLSGHNSSCAQVPVWRDAEITKGQNPMIDNVGSFGPCAIDGVLVKDIILTQTNQGITLTIHLLDGKCYFMMLANSSGLRLTDLTEIGFKGQYKANSIVGFNLIGTLQQ